MRILLVCPFLPHARAAHGGGVYLQTFARALTAEAEVALVALGTAAEFDGLDALPAGFARRYVVARAEPGRGSTFLRTRHQLRMLARWSAGGLPITVAKFRSAAMRAALRAAVRQFAPAAALVEMGLLAQYLTDLGPVASVLTDHEAADPVPAAIGPAGFGAARDQRLWDRYVARSYRAATALQTLNQTDAERLRSRLGRPVGVRPPLVDVPAESVAPATAPPRVLFFGDHAHPPNPEAAIRLAHEVFPRIRAAHPDAELWIAGPNAPPTITALAALPHVRIVGFVPDLRSLLGSVRLLLAPVFSGGGSRIKVLTALAHGLPVVSNALGLRGVDAPSTATRCEESAAGLADAALGWLADAAAAGQAGASARQWACATIDSRAVARAQVQMLTELVARQRAH